MVMISVIIITKQEEKHLPLLLDSLKKQTFRDFEVIVSDAHSTDNTRKIARKYGCKVVNGGLPSVGRNNGAKFAKGDIFFFFDADITLPKKFLEENVAEFKRKGLSVATPIYIPLSDKLVDKVLLWVNNSWAKLLERWVSFAGGVCIVVTKKVFREVGGFDEKMIIAEDNDFVKSCTKYGKFRVLRSQPLYYNVRRLEKEGRVRLALKYGYNAVYRVIFGDPYEALFNYELQGGVKIERGKRIEGQKFVKSR